MRRLEREGGPLPELDHRDAAEVLGDVVDVPVGVDHRRHDLAELRRPEFGRRGLVVAAVAAAARARSAGASVAVRGGSRAYERCHLCGSRLSFLVLEVAHELDESLLVGDILGAELAHEGVHHPQALRRVQLEPLLVVHELVDQAQGPVQHFRLTGVVEVVFRLTFLSTLVNHLWLF